MRHPNNGVCEVRDTTDYYFDEKDGDIAEIRDTNEYYSYDNQIDQWYRCVRLYKINIFQNSFLFFGYSFNNDLEYTLTDYSDSEEEKKKVVYTTVQGLLC